MRLLINTVTTHQSGLCPNEGYADPLPSKMLDHEIFLAYVPGDFRTKKCINNFFLTLENFSKIFFFLKICFHKFFLVRIKKKN